MHVLFYNKSLSWQKLVYGLDSIPKGISLMCCLSGNQTDQYGSLEVLNSLKAEHGKGQQTMEEMNKCGK
jgi:hypothetical protein